MVDTNGTKAAARRPNSQRRYLERCATRIGRRLFSVMIPHRGWTVPDMPHVELIEATSRDGLAVRGWTHRPPGCDRGTVLIMHGLLRNCTMDDIPGWAGRFARVHRMAAAAVDTRFHGRSGDSLPSFAYAEAWDGRAALDELERRGFPRPFVLMGGSLGALTAQRMALSDPRVAGAVLIAMPGWPWHGVRTGAGAIAGLAEEEVHARLPAVIATPLGLGLRVLGVFGRFVALLINASYGRDVLAAGDVRGAAMPAHRPRILSVIGDRDTFDWRATRLAWQAWYRDAKPQPNRWPHEAPDQDAWFVLVPGRIHPPGPMDIMSWEGLPVLIDRFLERVLVEKAD